ncbi:MAG: GntR family transcriptional regulator [Rhodospirillum sp.]|nr:GntR family transcriptional regulator [Rhodospirillum sp.]MCF8488566.1 GntR family transcriptional regulator [Rhodospirillum sp.]MCF8499162.1 GntR family transcriptional regulator [Rhodospirillum sp.]
MEEWEEGSAGRATARAADVAYARIRDGILQSHWVASAHLREQELADMTGVSRTPVREALRRLAADGLVTLVPNLGARVNEWSDRDLDEIFNLRAMLEGSAVELAASRVSGEQLAALEDLCDRMDALVASFPDFDDKALSLCNDRFHGLLLEASGNGRLKVLIRQMVEMPRVLRTFARYSERDLRRGMAHHREIVEALTLGDGAWAASVMHSHVRAARAVFANGGATDI